MPDEEEIWKPYPDYPFIEASNLGRIRTKDHWAICKNGGKRLCRGHILKQYLQSNGYMHVTFGMNGKIINLMVHRVIAISFLPHPNGYPEVNHIDNDPTNNRLDNLEWCTHEYNMIYREKHGRAMGRPVIAINSETSEALWFESQHEATRQLGVNQGHVNEVAKGYRNRDKGWWFTYADESAVEKTREKFGDKAANKVEKLISESCN